MPALPVRALVFIRDHADEPGPCSCLRDGKVMPRPPWGSVAPAPKERDDPHDRENQDHHYDHEDRAHDQSLLRSGGGGGETR
jgi:hypothetical protein